MYVHTGHSSQQSGGVNRFDDYPGPLGLYVHIWRGVTRVGAGG